MDTIDEENSSNLSKHECLLSEGTDSPEFYFDHWMRSIFNVNQFAKPNMQYFLILID